MRITLIAVLSLFLVSCKDTAMPQPPKDVVYHYLIDVDIKTQEVYCIRFNIISWNPYKIAFDKEVPLLECDNVGGYKPDDTKKVLNWIEDLVLWAENKIENFKL